METKTLYVAGQVSLVPVTIVFFVIIGIAINDKLEIKGLAATWTIVISMLVGVVVSIIELLVTLTRIKKGGEHDDKQEEIKERQRKMILELFGDDPLEEEE